uniref:NcyL n=1 Tax=Nannocystis sp. MB1016 TaxID=1696011 RepID=A0A0M4L955_9BACT|nr:NcyL [Nannocystis sp. MB1016]
MRPQALPEPPFMQVVVEDDEPHERRLVRAGDVLRRVILYLRGDLP